MKAWPTVPWRLCCACCCERHGSGWVPSTLTAPSDRCRSQKRICTWPTPSPPSSRQASSPPKSDRGRMRKRPDCDKLAINHFYNELSGSSACGGSGSGSPSIIFIIIIIASAARRLGAIGLARLLHQDVRQNDDNRHDDR